MNRYIILLLLFIICLLVYIIKNKYSKIEKFTSNSWTTSKDQLAAETMSLNDTQKTEVKNMITSISNSTLKTLITTQSPLLIGPPGPPGAHGPAGTKLIDSGRLINKSGSFDTKNAEANYFIPKYAMSRTEGTNENSSLSFMDVVSPFASYQNWQLDINNNLKNKFDGNCLTMSNNSDKLYMDKCGENPNQKWLFDQSNRLISATKSTNNSLKCLGLTNPEKNIITTNIPGCKGPKCMNNTAKKYVVVKDCDINSINDDELWSFI